MAYLAHHLRRGARMCTRVPQMVPAVVLVLGKRVEMWRQRLRPATGGRGARDTQWRSRREDGQGRTFNAVFSLLPRRFTAIRLSF